jgi:hypothetical protein
MKWAFPAAFTIGRRDFIIDREDEDSGFFDMSSLNVVSAERDKGLYIY